MTEFSGPQWCARFPTSADLHALNVPFRDCASAFVDALRAAGASVSISATYRPPERAYLMHYCCMVGGGGQDPLHVPAMSGVDIDWSHGGDLAAAKAAAKSMMAGYNIAFPAALVSRHTQRLAVDMTIHWAGAIQLKNKSGALKTCITQQDLWPVGASYGVIKLPTDAPHWSDDGH